MLFIKNKKEKENRKETRKKSLLFLPLIFRLLLKVEICSACRCNYSQTWLTLRALVGVHLRIYIALHGYVSLGNTSGPTSKAAGSEILLLEVLCKIRSRCISCENRVGHEQILYQADQDFRTKKLSYLIFSKSSEETSPCSEDKFRGHFKLRTRVKTACSKIHNLANAMWNWNTKNNKSEINTFKSFVYVK